MNNDNVEMKDILKEQNPPLTGLPRYVPGSSGFGLRDDQGNAVSDNWYSIETPTPSVEDQTARIGDYVLQKGTPVVVPNSPTDLSQKYKIAIGGSGLTSQEAVAQSVDMPSISGGAVQGAAIGSLFGPAGTLFGGLIGALNAYNANAEDALKKWQEENIKYDTAVEFYRDDTGKLKYKLDYSKMGTGGPRSGEGIKEAQNRETQVSLGDDGRLKVTVSPIFASTARFQELVNWISENYAGLTKDTENYEQILEEIKNGIDGETQSYVTNMRLYADYANRFPDASPEAIVAAYMTEVSGYIDPEKMGDFAMSVIGTSGIETKTAKDFFDSVLNMSLDDRNRLLERLNEIVYGDNDYGANEKAVAYGELKALYTVARNPEGYENDKYQGMLDADFFVTLMNSFSPLGLNAGDVLHFVSGGNLIQTKQEFLNQNDFARFVGTVGSVGAGFGLFKGATALIEKGMKLLPGTSQLFRASLEGQEGGALAFFAQNTGNTREVAKAATASAAFKTMKVGVFDAALAGSKTLVSGTDFWSEFGQDLARDAILEAVFSYYDTVQFQKAVNDSTVLVVRDPKTGNISKLPITEAQEAFDDSLEVAGAYNIQKTRAGEEAGIVQSEYGTTYYYNGTAVTVSPTGEVQKMLATPEGMSDGIQVLKTGVAEDVDVATTELTTVEQTLERMGLPKDAEIFALPSQSASAAEVAGKIAKLDTTKAGLAINTNLFNKNAALDTVNEIALAKTGDLTAWQNRSQKFVNVLDNANQEINLMRTGSYVKSSEQAFDDYQMSLGALNLTQKYKKADANFLKAITQLERAAYLDRHRVEGDTRNYTAEALEKYGDAIAKVPDDRAAVLREFNEKRKARHDATKASARKSGKIDIKKLDSFTDSDLQKEIGWVPQWSKKQTYNGLLSKFYGISQERNFYKEWLPEGGWVDLDKLEDPIKADERFLSFVATNMGITDMIENTASALDDARMLVDNTPTSETIRKRKLDSIKNKDELTKKFSDMVAEKKKEIKEKVPNQKQYKELMQKNIEESGILDAVENNIKKVSGGFARIGIAEQRDILSKIPPELQEAWYTNGTRTAREDIAKIVKSDMAIKNASLNRFYDDYSYWQRALDHEPLPFEEWVDSDITLYRYGDIVKDKKLNTLSYSVVPGGLPLMGGELQVITIKPSDTLGRPQLTGTARENEIFVDREAIKKGAPKKGTYEFAVVQEGLLKGRGGLSALAKRALTTRDIDVWTTKDLTPGKKVFISSDRADKEFGHNNVKRVRIRLSDANWDSATSGIYSPKNVSVSSTDSVIRASESFLGKLNEYNKLFSYDFDIESYMNTEYLPNLKEALNAKDMGLAATIVNQATLDVAPYRSQSSLLKSAQESVAEEWRDWAEKHIKAGRASNKELKKFAEDNDLELPDDKRPLPSKIKHALWERLESGGKMPKIEGLDISKLRAKYNNTTSSVNKEKVYKYGTFPDYSILPKPGHSVLYTNTPTKNLDSIQEKGLLVGRNIEKYPKSPEEGMVIWTDSTNPTTSNYGGNTVAFQVPSEELKKYAVNDTQHTIPHNIRREDILFIDKMYSAEPLIKASNIMSYVEKYGRDKTISVLKNKGADEEEIRNLIDVRLAGQSESGVTKEGFYKMLDETPLFQSATKDKKELVDLVAAEINGETVDAYEMGAATRAVGMDGRYPITWYRKGKPYTRFITYRNKEEQRLAEAITELFTDKQLIKQPGVISRVASFVANDFRLLTTGFDPTRAPLNFARDTSRGQSTSGGQSFINPQRIFNSLLETGSYTAAEKEKLSKALDNVAQMVAGETYNAAYRSGRNTTTQATKQYLSKTGANPLRRFTYSLIHDKRSIAEAPADFFEGLTRKRLAKSAAVVKLRQLQKDGASFEEQLKGMVDSAFFAGREYTANFARKGKLIEQTSKYVAYQSSAYAGLNGMKMAFINNPEGVSKNFAVFLIAYLILLADTLGDEDSRKNYYRLSEYDRGNSLVISLGDDTVLTIPLDQEVAAFLFPYRRFMETLNGVDPVSFFEFVWGTLTEPLPMDLSGFSEGEGFNLVRGLQKLTSQNMPNILAGIQEASTGYDLYYGTDIRVTDETLKDYGIYNPEAGDYTTTGNNSALLRQVANITGIPQWQLQTIVNNYGGNVGQYVLNILDKLGGASEDAQGGKDFANAVFKSFVATDQDAAQSAFYDGIQQLQGEKRKLIQKIADYNEDIKTASGDAKVELQIKLQQAKDEYAVKVADFVDKYISAYEITGGLSKSQAMQVYYLFRLDDDDTVYESGSPEEYYNNQAVQRFKNQATAMSAPILDKYYNNRIGNIYQDAEGTWRRYLSSGMQAMRNTIYGQGEEHMVGLLNILEGKDSKLKALRTQIKNARNKAYDAKDWTTRDALGYELDKAVVDAISPYIERYGAENVLGNSEVLDYLSDWFIVPDSFIKSKRGGHVSLANSGSTQEAFVRPYIKYVFGLPTNYYSYSDTSLTSPSLGEFGR